MKKKTLLVSVFALSAVFGLNSCNLGNNSSSAESTNGNSSNVTTSLETSSSEETISTSSSLSSASNVKTFKSAEIDATGGKVEYKPGETFSLEGIKIVNTFSNTLTDDTTEDVTDLSDYTVTIKDKNQQETKELLLLGEYDVTLTKGETSLSYKINVVKDTFDVDTVAKAIEVGKAHASFVNSGKYVKSVVDTADTTFSTELEKAYVFGSNFVKTEEKNLKEQDSTVDIEIIEDLGDDEYSYITKYYGASSYSKSYTEADENYMSGVEINPFSYDSELKTYGTEKLVSSLYELGKDNETFVQEVVEATETTKTKFTFGYTYEVYEGTSYDVAVEFELDDYGVISSAKYVATKLTYVYTYVFSQEVGIRNAINPAPHDSLYAESFKLKDEEGNEITSGQTLNISVSKQTLLEIDDLDPTTASLSVDALSFFIGEDDITNDFLSPLYCYYSDATGLSIVAYSAGEYDLTIKSEKYSITIKVVADLTDPTSITPSVYDDMYASFVNANDVEKVVLGDTLKVKGTFDLGEKEGYTATLSTQTDKATLTYDATTDSYTFSATEVGEYEVLFTATNGENVTATLTICVIEGESLEDLLDGTWYSIYANEGDSSTVTFYPDFNDPTTGEACFNGVDLLHSDTPSIYTYVIEGNTVTFTYVSGKDINPVLTSENTISGDYGYYEYSADAKGEDTGNGLETGINNVSVTTTGSQLSFVAPSTGTYMFSISTYNYEVEVYLIDPASYERVDHFEAYLDAGQKIPFGVISVGGDDEYAVLQIDKLLEVGTNTIKVESFFGTPYTFVASSAGTYTFSSTSPAYAGYSTIPYASGPEGLEYTVELEAGQSITLEFFGLSADGSEIDLVITKAL